MVYLYRVLCVNEEQRNFAFDIILCGDSHANCIRPNFEASRLTHSVMTDNSTEGISINTSLPVRPMDKENLGRQSCISRQLICSDVLGGKIYFNIARLL